MLSISISETYYQKPTVNSIKGCGKEKKKVLKSEVKLENLT